MWFHLFLRNGKREMIGNISLRKIIDGGESLIIYRVITSTANAVIVQVVGSEVIIFLVIIIKPEKRFSDISSEEKNHRRNDLLWKI